jgi:hypothetical protein
MSNGGSPIRYFRQMVKVANSLVTRAFARACLCVCVYVCDNGIELLLGIDIWK